MDRTTVMATLALTASVGALLFSWQAKAQRAAAASSAAPRIAAPPREHAPASSPRAKDASLSAIHGMLASLEARVSSLEQPTTQRSPLADLGNAAAPEPAQRMTEPQAAAGAGEGERAEFSELLERFIASGFDLSGSTEELERFWELAKTTDVIDERIEQLEASVDGAPGDVGARMDLADTYLAKLYTIPGGPEQGLWGRKAEDQWLAVIEHDPDHWEAPFRLGVNFSYYPDFLDKTKDALRYLERARELQSMLPPEDRFADTYLSLSRMYLRKQKLDQAREAIREGMAAHPSDERLLEAWADLER